MGPFVFFGICIGSSILLAIVILYYSPFLRGAPYYTKQQRFISRAREELHKRFPFLPADQFFPRITQSSPCCRKMMWEYDNKFTLDFFCNNCGKRYRKKYSYDTKEFLEELEHLPYERDLSALNEFWATDPWAANKINQ